MRPTYLFHKTAGMKLFNANAENMRALHDAGWRDSPDAAAAVEEKPLNIDEEASAPAQEAHPDTKPEPKPKTRKRKL